MAAPSAWQRRRVRYHGQVQGVGFRYTACSIARRYPVSGFVRNLPDGRVELVVEGQPEQIERLLQEVAAAMGDYVQDVRAETLPASGEFEGFEIRF